MGFNNEPPLSSYADAYALFTKETTPFENLMKLRPSWTELLVNQKHFSVLYLTIYVIFVELFFISFFPY